MVWASGVCLLLESVLSVLQFEILTWWIAHRAKPGRFGCNRGLATYCLSELWKDRYWTYFIVLPVKYEQ